MGESDPDVGKVGKTPVSKAFGRVGKKMLFLFDYGDGWRFAVQLVKHGEKQPGTRYPKVVGTSGKAPAQYPDMDEKDEE